jgi:hypothetical protein
VVQSGSTTAGATTAGPTQTGGSSSATVRIAGLPVASPAVKTLSIHYVTDVKRHAATHRPSRKPQVAAKHVNRSVKKPPIMHEALITRLARERVAHQKSVGHHQKAM